MTREQFAESMVYLYAGLSRPASQETIRVYFDMLGDLSHETFLAACRQVLLTHKWNTFPTIAELREAAVSIAKPIGSQLTASEAWQLAWDAANQIDLDIIGLYRIYHDDGKFTEYASQAASVMDSLPPEVVKAMRVFGLHELCYGHEPVGVARAQFFKVFEQLAERDKRVALLPPSVREFLETKRDNSLIKNALAGIGVMPQ